MLQVTDPLRPPANGAILEAAPAGNETFDALWMVKAVLRRLRIVIACGILVAAAAAGLATLRTPLFTASTTLNVTSLRLATSGQETFFAEAQFDPSLIETQIQIIASDPILRTVMGQAGLLSGAPEEQQKALREFRERLDVHRVGQSNIVEISVTDRDPAEAARFANAVATAYLARLDSERDASNQAASSWLRQRLRGVGPQAQVVSPAVPPVYKSGIGRTQVVVLAGVLGGGIGMFLALVLGFFDRRVRDPEEAVAAAGAPCLGLVPVLRPIVATLPARPEMPGAFSYDAAPAILRAVEDNPRSSLGQGLRHAGSAALARHGTGRSRSIGITSTLAGEGKSTIAANFALVAAQSGKRVLLVDAQPYAPALTRAFAPEVGGLMDFLAEGAPLSAYVRTDAQRGVDFLPLGGGGIADARALWSSPMGRLFVEAAGYDFILFDLPPLVATADVAAAAAALDGMLLVVDAGAASTGEMQAALAMADPVRERLIGTLLNRARTGWLERAFSPATAVLARQSELAGAGRHGA